MITIYIPPAAHWHLSNISTDCSSTCISISSRMLCDHTYLTVPRSADAIITLSSSSGSAAAYSCSEVIGGNPTSMAVAPAVLGGIRLGGGMCFYGNGTANCNAALDGAYRWCPCVYDYEFFGSTPPTNLPSLYPTRNPSVVPTLAPSSIGDSTAPSCAPTPVPSTRAPTRSTRAPTRRGQTSSPTTRRPSREPSRGPTRYPTRTTRLPSAGPTLGQMQSYSPSEQSTMGYVSEITTVTYAVRQVRYESHIMHAHVYYPF